MSSGGLALPRTSGTVRAAALALGAGLFAVMVYSAVLQMTGGPARHLEGVLYAAPAQTSVLRQADARALLARQPLSPVPFLVSAEGAAARNNNAVATRLFEQALLRNPRSVAVRLWLVERYLRLARFADAVVQLDAIMRIRPALRRRLVTVIVPLVANSMARRAVADALVQNPAWKADFLDTATRNATVAPAYYELLYALGGHRGFTLTDAELTRIVTTALSRGDARSAWMLYNRYSPRPAGDPANIVFDADFRGAAGPPPFNWDFAIVASGYALIDPRATRGRLDVHVFGGEPAVLATQHMMAKPGSYMVSTTVAADSLSAVDGLSWRLICDRSRVELGRLEIGAAAGAGAGPTGGPLGGVAINVPADCPVVSLALAYVPPPRPVLGTAALTSVVVAPMTGEPQ